jgi:integrase
MPKQHLTDRFIKTLEPQGERVEYYDQHRIENNTLKAKGVKGLFIRLTKAGSVYFYYRYWFNEKAKSYKIGSYPNIKLSEAREKARDLASEVNNGIDPQAEKNKRKHQPKTTLFEKLVSEYKQHHLPTLRQATREEYKRIIKKELEPKLKGLKVNEIKAARLSKILSRKKKEGYPTMANRIRAVLSSMFDYGRTDPEIDLKDNPVDDTRRYKTGENKRDRYYEDEEIRTLWEWFELFDQPVQSVFKMLLIAGQRKTETMNMKWDDIQKVKKDDFEGMVWTIPAEDAKNKKAHDVPLSDSALQVIETMRPITGETDYVFCSPRKDNEPIKWIKSSTKKIKDDKDNGIADFRPHDLRRTVATYMADSGISPMIIGKVLNHKGLAKENTITARYNRASYLEQKQEALERWSYKLNQILEDSEANITKIA